MDLLVLTLAGTLIGTVLAVEAVAWLPYVSRALVAMALDEFPEDLSEDKTARWAKEIKADLASLEDRPIGGLYFAVGVCLKGGKRLAAELALQDVFANEMDTQASKGRLYPFELSPEMRRSLVFDFAFDLARGDPEWALDHARYIAVLRGLPFLTICTKLSDEEFNSLLDEAVKLRETWD